MLIDNMFLLLGVQEEHLGRWSMLMKNNTLGERWVDFHTN